MVLRSACLAAALLVLPAFLGAQEPARGRGFRGAGGFPARIGPMSSPRPLLYGFALECARCSRTREPGAMQPVWEYDEYPSVRAVVDGGAAARAGIEVGDTLVAVDGVSILSSKGAHRLSLVQSGDRVALTFRRGSETLVRNLVVGLPGAARPGGREFRAALAGIPVGISGTASITATSDSAGVLIIETTAGTIRIRRY